MRKNYKLKDGEKFLGAGTVILTNPINTCAVCGRVWIRVPALAVVTDFGYWWACSCKNTLLQDLKKAIPLPENTFSASQFKLQDAVGEFKEAVAERGKSLLAKIGISL